MIALCIILGIILFFVFLLSIRVTVFFDYNEQMTLFVRWLFIKIPIYPPKEKKKGKKKKEKKPKEEEEEPEEEKPEEEQPKKENLFLTFYKNQGFSGVMELLGNTKQILGGMFASMGRHFVFRKLKCYVTVGAGDDAAATSMLYGKTCAAVFPVMGLITSTCRVKEYDCAVRPDYIKGEKSAVILAIFSIRPIFYLNALLLCGVKLIFKVVLKFLNGAKAPKQPQKQPVNISKEEQK